MTYPPSQPIDQCAERNYESLIDQLRKQLEHTDTVIRQMSDDINLLQAKNNELLAENRRLTDLCLMALESFLKKGE